MDRFTHLQSLSDEVKQLHPLLRVLLSNLPNIQSSEYRQGPREMGADFVLERNDPTLVAVEYVGVIVKTGKIKQDHREVERQIEECELERTYGSGRKKIVITEIWVISNDSISQGAQDKINHKYKNKSIKFVPGEKLVELINRFYPDYWTDTTVEVGEYFRGIKKIAAQMSASYLAPGGPTGGTYIEQELVIASTAKDFSRKRKSQRTTLSKARSAHRLLFVEASMGTGKTTLLANEAALMASPSEFMVKNEIPVLMTFKEFIGLKGDRMDAIAADVLGRTGVAEAKVVFFIDGMDEVDLTAELQIEALKEIKREVDKSTEYSVVISSRMLVAEVEKYVEDAYGKFRLSPFTLKQVLLLVDSICKSDRVRERLQKESQKSVIFRQLPKTPISAILLARLLNENLNEIPSSMTELYGKYMELVLGRWDISKGLQSQKEYEVLNSVVVEISKFVIDNSLQAFSFEEARDMFNNYVRKRNLPIDEDSTFKKMVFGTEIFTVSTELGIISFRHRTFSEYFYAQSLGAHGEAALTEQVFSPYWSTIYFFYFGIKRDAPELVDQLKMLEVSGEMLRLAKLVAYPSFLLAAYLTPYENIAGALRAYFREAAALYVESRSDAGKGFLSSLPTLDLLCIMTHAVSAANSYEFFADAVGECAEDLYSSPTLESDVDLVALFFMNSVLASLGDKRAYATLIADYGATMPLEFRIGIVEHSDEAGLKTDAIDRYAKRLHRSVRTNPAMASSLKALTVQRKPETASKELL